MSDTPRTDRLEYEQECGFDVSWEDHSRQLERENNAAKAENDAMKRALQSIYLDDIFDVTMREIAKKVLELE